MIKDKFESWMKASTGKFFEIYKSGPTIIKMRVLHTFFRIVFACATIGSIMLLLSSYFASLSQFFGNYFGLKALQKIASENPVFFDLVLLLAMVLSLSSLWLMKIIRIRNKHISEFYYFWDNHIETGRKLLKEN
ncbi:hypothetical protein L3049_02105 [Labilibaculum sp. DW002]|uniref:Uncharacterized protein n=1 Tax=Paralabilibaculum antarcticum TaxID=2912572 RepID=A0ABT5VMX4_9BACT|nr:MULTISPECIES: hypothetical protein [unclassified Labilibaculum]MBI9058627.1 hypothetical protein [Labilibaculum sp.]MDE5416784.1 hypothetical protein [Labilibaculum sp. DW002]